MNRKNNFIVIIYRMPEGIGYGKNAKPKKKPKTLKIVEPKKNLKTEEAKPKKKVPRTLKIKEPEKPKPKKKMPKTLQIREKVSSFKPKDIYTDDFLFRAEKNVEETMDYVDFDWIKGVSKSDVKFYRENQNDFRNLPEKKQDRIEKIEDKVRDNLRPSLEKDILKQAKVWIEKNKNSMMTLKKARAAFSKDYL